MQRIRLVLWAMVAAGLVAAGALTVAAIKQPEPAALTSAGPLGGEFQLVDQNGEPVTEAILRGRPTALFFGFTHCPDVCPTTLFEMANWIETLGEKVDDMGFVFVTVDPERDTPDIMRDYVGAFSERITGVTGEPEAVADMVKKFHIYARKVPLEGGGYTMDHTATVFLLDEEGRLEGTISRQETKETAVAKIERLVAQ
jgi:protein SCO1/2